MRCVNDGDRVATKIKMKQVVILLLCMAVWSEKTLAFYEWQGEQAYVEMRGLIRGSAAANRYPNDEILYPDRTKSGLTGFARLMVDGALGKQWSLEFNAYQTYIPKALLAPRSSLSLSTERSALFEHSFSNSDYVRFAVDRFALRWSNQNIDITIGRQAINLATTFYFTPNDFFAPFAAHTFYRLYKPGVDAVRAEMGLGEFSQLSLLSVLGYKRDADSDTGWSDEPDSHRASHLLHWSNVFGDFEGTLMLGRVVDKNIIGGALQGELFEWLGVRLEGHHADPQQDAIDGYQQFSLGLEHRWESSLELRLELYYNGLGANAVSDYQMGLSTNAAQYLACRYSALGGSYDITPLLIGEAVMISNIDDQSHLLSFNALYSLSDESEMVINMNIPFGSKPENGLLKSEFGGYPKSTYVEFRFYF